MEAWEWLISHQLERFVRNRWGRDFCFALAFDGRPPNPSDEYAL